MEYNKRYKPISKDSTRTEAENQDTAFVNRMMEEADEKGLLKIQPRRISASQKRHDPLPHGLKGSGLSLYRR